MLITKQDILLQNQRDNMAFQGFSQAMQELLISEMEACRRQRIEHVNNAERPAAVMTQAA
jgi:hypothetical protein